MLNEHGIGMGGGSYVIGIFNALRLREPDASISVIGMACPWDSNTQNMWARSPFSLDSVQVGLPL